jgi:hypothetical protein
MLEVARSRYLDYFRSTLDSLKADGRDVYAEICLDLAHREVRDPLYRLYVVDILERFPSGSSSVIECNVDPIELPPHYATPRFTDRMERSGVFLRPSIVQRIIDSFLDQQMDIRRESTAWAARRIHWNNPLG